MTIRLADARNAYERSGGKAARLSVMIDAGLPVKNGLVITTDEVEHILDIGRVPQSLLDEISDAMKFPVAVRSSAIGEDGELTWAGQFETKLQVPFCSLAEAILECAGAIHSDAVNAYAQTHEIARPKLALVIQEMVHAEIAGVLFTRHPVAGRTAVIEAVEGLGESLVSGRREPRRLYINLVFRKIKGTEGADTPVLTQSQVNELCRLGGIVKRLFGQEQDVEWAIEHGSGIIFLLQSRDITTSNKQEERVNTIGALRDVLDYEARRLQYLGVHVTKDVLSDQNIAELLTPHPCQMAFGLFTYIFAHGNGAIRTARNEMGYALGSELDTGFFHLVGGQPRCSIIHDALTYRIRGIPLSDYTRMIQHYIGRIEQDPGLANYPEVVLYDQNPSAEFLAKLFGKRKAREYRQAYDKFFENFRQFEDTLSASCRRDFLAHWREKIRRQSKIGSLNLPGLCRRYQAVADLLRTQSCCAFVKAARIGFFSYANLRNLLSELFGQEGRRYLDILTSGIPLEDNPNLRFSIELARVNKGETSKQEVVKEFGHLAMHELEISVPRYWEEPKMINALAQRMTGDPKQAMEESVERSQRLRSELVAKAGARGEELERAIRMAREYLSLRELVKFEYLRGYNLLRQIALRMEHLLQWDEGSIFHLDPQEIFVLDRNVDRFSELAAERGEQHEANKLIVVPPVIFSDRLEQVDRVSESETSRVLRGIGVTDIITEGNVVVVRSSDDKESLAQLRPGSILVTETTDPAWSPMLSVIGPTGGLVTEVGGLLAHGAIYAREIGMAAVLNVPNATNVLHTGMRVRVNGQGGYVEILD